MQKNALELLGFLILVLICVMGNHIGLFCLLYLARPLMPMFIHSWSEGSTWCLYLCAQVVLSPSWAYLMLGSTWQHWHVCSCWRTGAVDWVLRKARQDWTEGEYLLHHLPCDSYLYNCFALVTQSRLGFYMELPLSLLIQFPWTSNSLPLGHQEMPECTGRVGEPSGHLSDPSETHRCGSHTEKGKGCPYFS